MTEPIETPQEHAPTGDGELLDEMLDEAGERTGPDGRQCRSGRQRVLKSVVAVPV